MKVLKKKFRNFSIIAVAVVLSGCTSVKHQEYVYFRGQEIKKHMLEEGISPKNVFYLEELPEYEELTYNLKYLGMTIGTMTATNKGITKIKGRDAYHFELTAKTTPFFSKFFHVDDRMVSYMDVEKRHALRHEVYRREGSYEKDAIVDFDQVNNKAYYRHLLNGTEEVIDIPPDVQDPLTVNYFFRMTPWRAGDTVEFQVYVDEKVYDVLGLVEERKTISLPNFGRKEVFIFQPYAKLDGENVKKGRAIGYFAADELKTPLQGLVKTPIFGKAAVVLSEIKRQ